MIISRTPFRLSFFGGGTDYPAWYRKHSGAVLATTIDKYCYITCRYLPPFFEHRFCSIYSKMEYCQAIDEIVPSRGARGVALPSNCDRGFEIHHDGDLPARSGMGSSSAFTVGLLHALYALKGRMATKQTAGTESMHIEQEHSEGNCRISGPGAGGARRAESMWRFTPNGEMSVRPDDRSPAERMRELNSHLMLFYTGIKRTASNVAQSYVNDIEDRGASCAS